MSVQQRAAIPTRTRWSSYKFCVRAASCEQVASLRKSRCQGFSFFSPPISGLKRKKCFLGARANQQNKDELRSNSCLASSSYLYIDERRFRIERLVWNDSGMEKLAFKLQIRCWRLERPFSGGYGSCQRPRMTPGGRRHSNCKTRARICCTIPGQAHCGRKEAGWRGGLAETHSKLCRSPRHAQRRGRRMAFRSSR